MPETLPPVQLAHAVPPFPARWRTAHGGPPVVGRVRETAEDFVVDESLGFAPSGSGEHAMLRIRKRNTNTAWLAGRLAELAGVPRREVGYSGLKDRLAVTTQWFTVGLAGRPEPDWSVLEDDSIELLEVARHHRKLRRGTHQGNRFRLRVHGIDGDRERLHQRLVTVAEQGFPNYFGAQRFGRDGANLAGAARLFADPRARCARQQRGFYLSAARSLLFNTVLDRRISRGDWCGLLPGDVLMLDGRQSVFVADPADGSLAARLATLELHVTGPLGGAGDPLVSGTALAVESAALAGYASWLAALQRLRVNAARRALRARLREVDWQLEGDTLELVFTLDSGCYATAALAELVASPAAVIG